MGVVGKVGCGKSSLLAAITAEMRRKDGQVRKQDVRCGKGSSHTLAVSPFCRSVWLTFLMALV